MGKKKTDIRSFLAGFLLLVFCLGITPKQVLHDLLTNHRHIPGQHHREATIDVQPSKYVCDIHDQVAESPFVEPVELDFTLPHPSMDLPASVFHEAPFRISIDHADLRGPPSLA